MVLNLSCPAVSQICTLTVWPSSVQLFTRQSTPAVLIMDELKLPSSAKHVIKLVWARNATQRRKCERRTVLSERAVD